MGGTQMQTRRMQFLRSRRRLRDTESIGFMFRYRAAIPAVLTVATTTRRRCSYAYRSPSCRVLTMSSMAVDPDDSSLNAVRPEPVEGHSDFDRPNPNGRETLANISGNNAEDLFFEGNRLMALGTTTDLAAAEACYRQAIVLVPDFAEALANLGLLRQGVGAFAEAEHCLRRAVAIDPNCAQNHLNLGVLLAKLK